MARRTSFLIGLIGIGFSWPAAAADWPQWRGPNRDGISQETGLLKKWPDGGPKLVWQSKEMGDGYSTPAIVRDRLYAIGNHEMEDEFVVCLATTDGKAAWTRRIGSVGPNRGPQYPGSRSTPTVEGNVLYALGSNGDLVCLATSNGQIRWHKNLVADFGGKIGAWAYAESPLVDGDVLVCTPGGTKATLVALDKKTGKTIWKCAVPGGDAAAYSSAIVVEAGGVKQYVQFLGKGLVGVEAKTGKFLWRYDRTAQGSPANIPTPVAHDSLVYSSSGRGGGGLVELKIGAGGIQAVQVYFNPKLPTSIGGTVDIDGNLYGTNSQGLMCVDFKTGAPKWQNRGVGAAAICYADGNLYLHGEQHGDVALVEASPEKYIERGRFLPPDVPERGKSKSWTYPVVANGRLYIRDLGSLWSYDVRGEASARR